LSQVKTLPITATRWLSLLLCAITAATITVFLSKVGFVQKAYSSLGAILNANPVLHYSSAFLAGIGIKLLLDKFYISHSKRSIVFSWRYPPVTISLWLSVTIIGLIFYFTSNQEELIAATSCCEYFIVLILGSSIITAYQQSNERISLNLVVCFSLIAATSTVFIYWHISQAGFSWPLFVTVDVYIFIAIFLTSKYINECIKAKWNRNQITLERTPSVNPGDFKTLDQFKSWFKDDSTIKSTELLEPDLQVYSERITERLRNGGDKYEKDLAQHIALCGPYGCGKSSIVESIVNDLAKNSEKESTWIHSDISTWGAASGSVAHVVLSNIIDDISQHIDMCAFRALPKHYTEALKSGGSFFQFASTLLAGPVDIEQSFQKLNDVLEVTNHKLLISLQDVDRGRGDENEKRLNDIAALLDRLKKKRLRQINFIIAMGNNKLEHIDVLSKVADHLETILTFDCSKLIIKWWRLNIEKLYSNQMKLTEHLQFNDIQSLLNREATYFNAVTSKAPNLANNLIYSIRMLKRIMRRVDSCWVEGKLLGEVDFNTLLLLIVLKESSPSAFNCLVTEYRKAEEFSPFEYGSHGGSLEYIMESIEQSPEGTSVTYIDKLLKEILDIGKTLSRSGILKTQKLQNKLKTINYLDRMMLENVPVTELRDQDVIKEFLQADLNSINVLADKILSDERWLISFERFESIFHWDEYKDIGKLLALALLDNSEADNAELLYRGDALKKLLKEKVINSAGELKMVVDKLPPDQKLAKDLTEYWKSLENTQEGLI
jgi:hypothetical protein